MTTGLRIRGLTKSYGANRVLDDLDLDVEAGSVHALLGHNGAGKSTLIKCINGSTAWDAGQVSLSGTPQAPGSPAAAEAAGIATIHQHLSLIDTLSIEQNIHLGREPRWGILCRTRTERRAAMAMVGRLGLDVSPGVKVARLGAGQKQLVEIAKALSHSDVKVLILDEPTASLSSAESEVLFKEIAGLRADGVAIIYVTHRLPEVFRIADQVTVMRNGQVVLSAETAAIGPREVITALTGDAPLDAQSGATTGATTGAVRTHTDAGTTSGLIVEGLRGPRFGPASFTVAPGEIVGVFGSLGSGRTSLLETLAGLHRPTAGRASIDGEALPRGGPRRRIRDGVVLIPGDRNGQGLWHSQSASFNALAPHPGRGVRCGLRSRKAERRLYAEVASRVAVHPDDPDAPVWTLSGGNAQKVMVGRWLSGWGALRALLVDDPTNGVDIDTRRRIHRLLSDVAGSPLPVLVSSNDAEELCEIADRVLVVAGGRLVAEVAREQLSPAILLEHAQSMTGSRSAPAPVTPVAPDVDKAIS